MAGYMARDLMDFNRAGQAMRLISPHIPFLNPGVQGPDKVIRYAMANPGKFAARTLAYVTVPALTLYAINRDNPAYRDLPLWRKDQFWNVPLPGDHFLSIPKPPGTGVLFGSSAERIADWMATESPEAWDGFAEQVRTSFTPNVVPAIVSGLLTKELNRNLQTGQDIVPKSELGLLPEAQASDMQGEVTRFVGKVFNVSPRMVEALVRAQLGGTGTNLIRSLDLAEKALAETMGRPPEPGQGLARDVPFIGPVVRSFLVDEPTTTSRSVEKFYENKEALDRYAATFAFDKSGSRGPPNTARAQQNVKDNGPDIEWAVPFAMAAQKMAEGRTAIAFARKDASLSLDQRQERILMLGRVIRQIAADMNKQYREANATRERELLDPLGTMNQGQAGVQFTPR